MSFLPLTATSPGSLQAAARSSPKSNLYATSVSARWRRRATIASTSSWMFFHLQRLLPFERHERWCYSSGGLICTVIRWYQREKIKQRPLEDTHVHVHYHQNCVLARIGLRPVRLSPLFSVSWEDRFSSHWPELHLLFTSTTICSVKASTFCRISFHLKTADWLVSGDPSLDFPVKHHIDVFVGYIY